MSVRYERAVTVDEEFIGTDSEDEEEMLAVFLYLFMVREPCGVGVVSCCCHLNLPPTRYCP